MKKYFIPLVFSFCFLASAMKEKEQLSDKQLETLKIICNPLGYNHCMDRARQYLTNTSPLYDYAKTEEFVAALLEKLSIRFQKDKTAIAQTLDTGLTNNWLKKNNS